MIEQLRRVVGDMAVCERLGFRLAWLLSSAQLRLSGSGTYRSLPPEGADAAVHYRVQIRPPAHIVTSVVHALERLRGISSHHYYYPADRMHVTVGSVSRFLREGSNVAALDAELRTIISSYPSFDLTLRGLNVSPITVFAQVLPHSRTLRALRTDLRMLGHRAGRASGFGDYIRDLLPHMNIVRFSRGVTADFLEEVSRTRQVWFGRWTVREVEVIRTDTLLSREREGRQVRRVLERIPLAPIHPSA